MIAPSGDKRKNPQYRTPSKLFLFENLEAFLNLLQAIADSSFGDPFCGGNVCVAHAAEFLEYQFTLLGKKGIPQHTNGSFSLGNL